MRAIRTIAASVLPLVLAVGCSSAPETSRPVTAVANVKAPAYNVKKLLKPKREHLGIYVEKPGTIAARPGIRSRLGAWSQRKAPRHD